MNEFVTRLLALQQDAADAISTPASWRNAPLLEVTDTPTYRAAEEMLAVLADAGAIPVWHFFVGSPGNGKSAATGMLVRRLYELGWIARTPDGVDLMNAPDPGLPVAIEMFAPGDARPSLIIAQDASVVRDPFSDKPDPGADFLDVLAHARASKSAVWACLNRGILERAVGLVQSADLHGLLSTMADNTNGWESRTIDGLGILARWVALDEQSLIRSSSAEMTQLIDRATAPEHWAICESCPAKERCPFRANMHLLANPVGREHFLRLAEDAELLSMQPIVFREAQALLSTVLAGVRDDYVGCSPCEWVQTRDAREELPALVARRIPMLLFSSASPMGLTGDEIATSRLPDLLACAGGPCLPAQGQLPSANVGLRRLLGPGGAFDRLDPFSGPLTRELAGDWEVGLPSAYPMDGLLTALEQDLRTGWERIEEVIADGTPDPSDIELLQRWRSAISVRYGAFAQGTHWFSAELTSFRRAAGIEGSLSTQEREQEAEEVLTLLQEEGSGAIRLAPATQLDIAWVQHELHPDLSFSATKSLPRVSIEFGKAAAVNIPTEAYCWLLYRLKTGLLRETMPQDVVTAGRLALQRAAAQGHYSTTATGRGKARVTLIIESPDGQAVSLRRWDLEEVKAEVLE